MKKFLFSLFVLIILISTATVARAVDYGLEGTASVAGLKGTGVPGTVSSVIGNVIGAGLAMVGVLFFILMIYAGIKWMTARGNEDQSKKALDTITAAIIGLIVVVASYAITQFVFRSVGSGGGSAGGGGAGAADAGCCILCASSGICSTAGYFPSNASGLCKGGKDVTARIDPKLDRLKCK